MIFLISRHVLINYTEHQLRKYHLICRIPLEQLKGISTNNFNVFNRSFHSNWLTFKNNRIQCTSQSPPQKNKLHDWFYIRTLVREFHSIISDIGAKNC